MLNLLIRQAFLGLNTLWNTPLGKCYNGTSVHLRTHVIVRITIWLFLASRLGTQNLASRLRNTNKHFMRCCQGRLRITCQHFAMFIIMTGIKKFSMQANFECLLCLSMMNTGRVWLVSTCRWTSLKILSHSWGELELISVLPSVYVRKLTQLPLCHLHQLLWPLKRRLFANILLPLLIRC
jgi:hypothetical protein